MHKQEYQGAARRNESLEHALQQAVTKALAIIWQYRFDFTSKSKISIGDRSQDFCSSVDHKAQEEMVAHLRSKLLLVEYEFLCEESGVERCTGSSPYFTIDPLDGTCAFMRGNWHAVSAMGAAVREDEVEAVCIGDLTTRDLISYGPTSPGVKYISGEFHRLLPNTALHFGGLEGSRLLLRRPVTHYSSVIQKLAEDTADHLITDESLGVWMPRLWKQEVRMAVLCKGSKITPWDITPIIGISRRLGYLFLRAIEDGTQLERFVPGLPVSQMVRTNDVLILHEQDLYLVQHLLRR